MTNSVKKSDIYRHLRAKDITPHHPDFLNEVEAYLLQKFGLLSYEINEFGLEKIKKNVLAFRRKIRRFSQHDSYKKDEILAKHEVREFVLQ